MLGTTWGVFTILTGLDAGSRAERSLSRENIECYNPKIETSWIVHHKPVPRLVQLFPGYLFVVIPQQWQKLLSFTGITGIIRDGDGPLPVTVKIIDSIRAMERDGVVRLPQPDDPPRYRVSQPVRLSGTADSFAGHIGLYAGMDGHQRASVLFWLLGRWVPRSVPLDGLEVVQA